MLKISVVFSTILFSVLLTADIFKVKIGHNDDELKDIAGRMDVLGAGVDENGDVILIINAKETEISEFPVFTEIEQIPGDIEIDPEYYDLDEINRRIDNLGKQNSGYAEVFVIGSSIEGREIKAVRITRTGDSTEDLPEILLVGTHHAREWISYEVPLSIAEFLMENADSNSSVADILDKSVVWVVPMLNPDGFVFSWESERYWRNNRRVNPDSTIGVDLNRNYDSSWIKVEYDHGTGPFSEPETVAIKQLIENSFPEPFENGITSLDGLITYHSFGQMIMYPPGSTTEPAEKSEYYKELAINMSNLTFSECGSIYLAMQASDLYFTFGEMTEWFMNTHDGNPAFTIELRPHSGGVNDFVLPAQYIKDTVKENISPAMYLIEHIITGETVINMDKNGNGKSDVTENTLYDYKCDRSDLEVPDYGDFSNDSDADVPDDGADDIDAGDDDFPVFDDEPEIDEKNDTDTGVSSIKKSGCSITILGD
ncbi:MAG TPA: M14 family zinc carboxypeptidase [bacterium]|nr:M14 family zinc carboxypeptidase [bacterium]HPS30771.1 M14 family zinc carboxypeptidase [bacterium]